MELRVNITDIVVCNYFVLSRLQYKPEKFWCKQKLFLGELLVTDGEVLALDYWLRDEVIGPDGEVAVIRW